MGRRAGTAKDYDYSPALAGARHRWNRQMLLAWLTDPETVVPGQRMGYRVEEVGDREDVVAFLTAKSKEHSRHSLK
jgi:cytochrome c